MKKAIAKPTRPLPVASAGKAASPKPTPPERRATLSKAAPAKSHPTVRLEFYAPQAREVYVAGSFNEWRPSATVMKTSGGGLWAGELALAPGQYEYLFLVDGQWLPDPRAKAYAPNPFGGMNSLLEVGQSAASN
jgi:1,4-alpha-glucan branching enzyme